MKTRFPLISSRPLSRLLLAVVLALMGLDMPAQADTIYLVVSASNPLRVLNTKEAQSLYMGRSRSFATGEPAVAIDLARSNPVRDAFYLSLTGMSPAQINSYWSRLMFTGQTQSPKAVDSEQQVIETIRRNPSAIGYLSKEPADPGLRTVLVLKGRVDS